MSIHERIVYADQGNFAVVCWGGPTPVANSCIKSPDYISAQLSHMEPFSVRLFDTQVAKASIVMQEILSLLCLKIGWVCFFSFPELLPFPASCPVM